MVMVPKRKYTLFFSPRNPNGFLSNWHKANFTVDGCLFTSTEQYYMYQKAIHFGDHVTAKKILMTSNP